ncbi:MAG TPA: LuxR C-terminal-related transcriptional regulator [Nocardioides sp.]|nr:LuxR C-terminal-related transcriptional regulator [Nocardioides sp.]
MTSATDNGPETSQLPVEVTSFVGRRSERTDIRELLAANRLVTLTGFGGIGKTRLALKVASEVRRAFRDGVAFVPLASLSEPDLVANTIAAALGLEGRSTRAAATVVVEYLKDRSTLLLLDNCEHIVDSVAILADTLLRTCPDLRILATSREPLRIQGEAVHAVQPLSAPRRGDAAPLQGFEAVELFLERARALVPDIEVTPDNREAISTIVSRLEGIPLAIELAAGRLRAMSPQEMERNLTERWELVSRGSRTAPQRQRTMAACIEWSFDLCTPTERELWARLSVFADGFGIDAAREVCGAIDEPFDDVLLDLVDKSIVIPIGGYERTTFRMLPPIRHRGRAQLEEAGELGDLRRRHRDWYAAYARTVAAEWPTAAQVDHMERLRRERANLTAAVEFCTSTPGEEQPGLEIGANLLEYGEADGLYRDSRVWFDRLFARTSERTEVRARALRAAAWFAAMQGDLDRAGVLLEEGRGIAQEHGGHTEVLLTQTTAFMAMFNGDTEGAVRLFDDAITGFQKYDDVGQEAHTLALSALNHVIRGDLAAAMAAHERCVALTEPAGERWYRSYSLWIIGMALVAAGRADEGKAAQRESLQLKRATRDNLGIGTSVEAVAYSCAETEPARAAELLGAAAAIWSRIETSTEALPGLHALHEQCETTVRSLLDQAAFDAAFERGRELSPDAAVDLALEESTAQAPRKAPGAPRRSRRGGPSGSLTPRERQIAELVATGATNKDIASTLVISKRTAETHVEHILTKLGFTNRGQISAWVTEQSESGGSGGSDATR